MPLSVSFSVSGLTEQNAAQLADALADLSYTLTQTEFCIVKPSRFKLECANGARVPSISLGVVSLSWEE